MDQGEVRNVVHRGGSFIDIPDELRSAKRNGDPPNECNFFVGFRIARTLQQ